MTTFGPFADRQAVLRDQQRFGVTEDSPLGARPGQRVTDLTLAVRDAHALPRTGRPGLAERRLALVINPQPTRAQEHA